MKRLLVILLSLILLTNIASSVYASDAVENSNAKAEFMKTIGVMTALPSNYDAYVSRAEFAMYAARIVNVSEYGQADKRLFIDLPMDHWAAYAINGLVESGIISSAPNGKFRPDDVITAPEAVKMLVCALGYKTYAEANGGYPNGYLKAGRQIDIISNTSASGNLTYADVVDMLYDALNAEILKGTGFTDDGVKYTHSENDTLLSVYRNIYRIEGTVTAVDGVAVNEDCYAGFGEIAIGNEIFEYDGEPFEYLGKNVVLYYKQVGSGKGKTIFVFSDSKKNEVVEFDAEDFIKYDTALNKVSYYAGSAERSIRVSGGLHVVKNGDIVASDLENTVKNIEKGRYTFVDSDNNGVYEMLAIAEYENIIVSYVDVKNNLIYRKYDINSPLDATNDVTKKVLIYKDSKQIAVSDIKTDDVLTVYDSEIYTRIYVNTLSVTGRISSVIKTSESTEICIDDKRYEVDKDVEALQGVSVRNGMEGTFIIDIFGKVAYVRIGEYGDGYTLGYIVNSATVGTMDKSVMLKLYVPADGLVEYTVSDNVKIDGTKAKTESEIKSLLSRYNGNINGQVVFFTNTDKVIKVIDTPYFDEGIELDNSIKPNISQTGVKYRQKKFGKTIICDGETVIIGVPNDENLAGAEQFDFSSLSTDGISISKEFNVDSYKFDLESGFDDVVVIKNYASGNPTDELVVVGEIASAVKNDDVVECLTYYRGGASSEIYVDADKSLTDDGIKQGDIIRIGKDAKGDIIRWETIFSYKADATPSDVNEVNYGSLFNTTDRVVFGYVKSVKDGVMKLYRDKNKPDVIDEVFNLTDVELTVYDSSASRDEHRISSGNYNDITAYDTVGIPAMAIVRTNLAQVKDVIIFK